jgi:hypothetical protein
MQKAYLASEADFMHTSRHASTPADARALTHGPLRNRIRVELHAPVAEVWTLIGNLPRFPEYSSGLERVDAMSDSSGTPLEFVCHFKPRDGSGVSIAHRELIRWYEAERGYASSGEQGNVFGLSNDLNLVILEPSKRGTLVTWEQYFDAQDLDMMKEGYDQALADIGENLIRRFGGAMRERYVERSP